MVNYHRIRLFTKILLYEDLLIGSFCIDDSPSIVFEVVQRQGQAQPLNQPHVVTSPKEFSSDGFGLFRSFKEPVGRIRLMHDTTTIRFFEFDAASTAEKGLRTNAFNI